MGLVAVPLLVMVAALVGYHHLEVIPMHVYWLIIGMMGVGALMLVKTDPHIMADTKENSER